MRAAKKEQMPPPPPPLHLLLLALDDSIDAAEGQSSKVDDCPQRDYYDDDDPYGEVDDDDIGYDGHVQDLEEAAESLQGFAPGSGYLLRSVIVDLSDPFLGGRVAPAFGEFVRRLEAYHHIWKVRFNNATFRHGINDDDDAAAAAAAIRSAAHLAEPPLPSDVANFFCSTLPAHPSLKEIIFKGCSAPCSSPTSASSRCR